ncbi:MAG: nitronate monooxygenase [Deltaproteobacteria bacterium HGW-Deltaproteobacteria-19]|nr:MAG: nitronate monooxygenase [Deltaproteobacteria bacterium HGW-Deltaproteobacteria-19]
MFKTRLTEMLGIPHPIMMGGMQLLSTAEFTAAAANAGVMAFLAAETFPSPEALREEIRKTRRLTDRPFGVNISMLPDTGRGERSLTFAGIAADEKVAAVETAGSDPAFLVPILKEAGVRVFHKVPSIRFARKAVAGGVDGIIIVGFECGGHPGMDDVPLSIILPRAVDELPVPVIAAGGIADARGFASALCLGADGVLMGTRFVVTEESTMCESIKKRYLEITENDTTLIMRSLKNPFRCYKNSATKRVLEMEARGASLLELLTVVGGQVSRDTYAKGDPDGVPVACSLGAALIHDVKPIADVVNDIVEGAHAILSRLRSMEEPGTGTRAGAARA